MHVIRPLSVVPVDIGVFMKIKVTRRIAIVGTACSLTLGALVLTPHANAGVVPPPGYQPTYGGTNPVIFNSALQAAGIDYGKLFGDMQKVTREHKGKPTLSPAVY